MLLAFASLLGCLLTSSHAKVYSRCELAKVLHDFGLEGYRGSTLADCEDCPHPQPRSPPSPLSLLGCGRRSFLSLSPPLSIQSARTRRVDNI